MKVEKHDLVQSEHGDISLSDIAARFRETKMSDIPILHFDEVHRRARDEQHNSSLTSPAITDVAR